MEFLVTKAFSSLLLPPGINLLLAGLGGLVMVRWRRLGVALILVALLALYALSLPAVGEALLASLETYPALSVGNLRRGKADAIVVLAAGRYSNAPEYDGYDAVSRYSLERVRYGARLYHQTGLPVLLTGGAPYDEDFSLAFLMKETLVDDFRAPVVWTEEQSRTTAENAELTKIILEKEGISRFYLVTHAWHMPRAMAAFRRLGLEPIAAPTGFTMPTSARSGLFLRWLPSARALLDSSLAFHEYLGRAWYALSY